MRYKLSCNDCPRYTTWDLSLTTDRCQGVKCPSGHEWLLVFRSPGWARLFERGLRRVAAGSLRDAVLDASTAFDLYLSEVPVRARYDREVGASPRCLRKELAAVIGRAVPALGAARAVASLVSGKPPPAWRDKVIENVRNEAVHMGRYPSPADAENLCREVATKIVEFEKLLSTQKCVNEAPFYMKLYLEDAEDAGALPPGLRTLWFSSGLLFETGGARESDSVDAHLSEYKNSPDWEKQTWV